MSGPAVRRRLTREAPSCWGTLAVLFAFTCCAGPLELMRSEKVEDQLDGIARLSTEGRELSGEAAMGPLVALLASPNARVRGQAYEALRTLRLADGRSGLETAVADDRECPRVVAALVEHWDSYPADAVGEIVELVAAQRCREESTWLLARLPSPRVDFDESSSALAWAARQAEGPARAVLLEVVASPEQPPAKVRALARTLAAMSLTVPERVALLPVLKRGALGAGVREELGERLVRREPALPPSALARTVTESFWVYRDHDDPPCADIDTGRVCPGEDSAFCAYAAGWQGDYDGLAVDTDVSADGGCADGECLRFSYDPTGGDVRWTGVRMQWPADNWGHVPGGLDLTGATALVFRAKATRGRPRKCFAVGGIVSGRFPSSLPIRYWGDHDACEDAPRFDGPEGAFEDFRIELGDAELSRVISPFGVTFLADDCAAEPCAILVDDIRVDFTDGVHEVTSHVLDPDSYNHERAFTYDVALTILALLPSDPDTAFFLADMLVLVLERDLHERSRLYDAYFGRDLVIRNPEVPGVERVRSWPGEGSGSSTGNVAWALLSLLRAAEAACGVRDSARYLDAARQLAAFIAAQRSDEGYGGFWGGWLGPDERPAPFKSTEHAIDIWVAMTLMDQWFPAEGWADHAEHARAFVQAMGDADHYLTGTSLLLPGRGRSACLPLEDERCPTDAGGEPSGCEECLNRDVSPLDVNTWAVLAGIPEDAGRVLDWVTRHCGHEDESGHAGVGFQCPGGGIWTEGTGQMAAALRQAGRLREAGELLESLVRIQETLSDGGGLVAADRDCLSTGFHWHYFQREHTGATAWAVFAAMPEWNPLRTETATCPAP